MKFGLVIFLLTGGLLLGMVIFLEIGRRAGGRLQVPGREKARPGTGAVDAAVFALLGLLIAFTFSGGLTRFDNRRQLIMQEANAVGTAYLRLDMLLPDDKGKLQDLFRKYLDTRLDAYRKLPDISAAKEELAKSIVIQNQIWTNALPACKRSGNPASWMLLVTALNQMIDISNTRTMVMYAHPPLTIYLMLAVLALAVAFLAGYGMAGAERNWIYLVIFPLIISITVYVILDVEFPRLGFIRVDPFDRVLQQVRQSMD